MCYFLSVPIDLDPRYSTPTSYTPPTLFFSSLSSSTSVVDSAISIYPAKSIPACSHYRIPNFYP